MLETFYMVSQSLAAAAVIATVAYFSLQTRLQARISEAELYHAVTQSWIGLFSKLQEDSEFARLARVALHHWDELSDNQKLMMHAFWSDILAHLDAILALGEKGLIPQHQVQAWTDNTLSILITPGASAWWQSANFLFGPQLKNVLEARLKASQTLPPACTAFHPWQSNDEDLALVRDQDPVAAPG